MGVCGQHVDCYRLSAKRCADGGTDFFTVIKICLKHCVLLLLRVCIHKWSVSQWKQHELQIWSSWKNKKNWKWKAPRNPTPENRHTHGEYFRCFHSRTWRKHYFRHQFAQRRYCFTQFISNRLSLSFVFGVRLLEAPKYSLVKRYVCWNISRPALADSVVKNRLSLSSKLYSSHCGMSLHQAPMFYLTAKCLGSLKNFFCQSS